MMTRRKITDAVQKVWDDNEMCRDHDVDGVIRLADVGDPLSARYLRRMFAKVTLRRDERDSNVIGEDYEENRAELTLTFSPPN